MTTLGDIPPVLMDLGWLLPWRHDEYLEVHRIHVGITGRAKAISVPALTQMPVESSPLRTIFEYGELVI